MSELMTPISFRQLMTWITAEYDREGSVFGVHRPFHPSGKTLPIFGETIETPFGPAAGQTPSWPRTSWQATSAAPGSLN